MAGFLHRLSRLPRAARREESERVLRESFARLGREPAVAAVVARLGRDDLVVTHYTFDEPDVADGGAAIQFTYHLARADVAGGADDEIRGSGIAIVDDRGAVRFSDVDAEIYRPADDDEAPRTD